MYACRYLPVLKLNKMDAQGRAKAYVLADRHTARDPQVRRTADAHSLAFKSMFLHIDTLLKHEPLNYDKFRSMTNA